jgi:hypothetical protein
MICRFTSSLRLLFVGRDDEIVDLYDDDSSTAVSGTEDEYAEIL